MSRVPKISAEFRALLKNVKAKRPKTVIQHILQHGQITTEELRDIYGYNHPPRAIRDVRENGIPIVTTRVVGNDGRKIAAYSFGDLSNIRINQTSGRTVISSRIKNHLISKFGPRCNIYLEPFPERELQVDHRVPFEIAGDPAVDANLQSTPQSTLDEYMLLSPSANRAKSWSCENCPNWKLKIIKTCHSCYWAHPENYEHVAMRLIRRLDISWSGAEVKDYERLQVAATTNDETMPDFVKSVLLNHLRQIE